MRMTIHEGGLAATPQEMPLGSAVKREVATLTRNLEVARVRLAEQGNALQLLHNRLTNLESKPLIVNAHVKGEKGDRGEPGQPGQTHIITVAPDFKPGAWFKFWRKWLLGIDG